MRNKNLEILKTIIGKYEVKNKFFVVLYGNIVLPCLNGRLKQLKPEVYEKTLKEFFTSDLGKEYIIPSKSVIEQDMSAIKNNLENELYVENDLMTDEIKEYIKVNQERLDQKVAVLKAKQLQEEQKRKELEQIEAERKRQEEAKLEAERIAKENEANRIALEQEKQRALEEQRKKEIEKAELEQKRLKELEEERIAKEKEIAEKEAQKLAELKKQQELEHLKKIEEEQKAKELIELQKQQLEAERVAKEQEFLSFINPNAGDKNDDYLAKVDNIVKEMNENNHQLKQNEKDNSELIGSVKKDINDLVKVLNVLYDKNNAFIEKTEETNKRYNEDLFNVKKELINLNQKISNVSNGGGNIDDESLQKITKNTKTAKMLSTITLIFVLLISVAFPAGAFVLNNINNAKQEENNVIELTDDNSVELHARVGDEYILVGSLMLKDGEVTFVK